MGVVELEPEGVNEVVELIVRLSTERESSREAEVLAD